MAGLSLDKIPSITSFSAKVPSQPKGSKKQEEKETHKAWANAMVVVGDQPDEAVSPVKSQDVGVDEVKSQVTKNTAEDAQPQSVNPVESKKKPTPVNAERTSTEEQQSGTTKPAESTKESTAKTFDSNSDQHVQPVSKEPVESKEESNTVQITEDLQGASLTTANDGRKQGINDAAANTMENQSDAVETKQHEDTQVTVQRSRAGEIATTETEIARESTTVQIMDSLADVELMTPINDDPDSATKEKENVIEVQQHEDNAKPPAQTRSADTPQVQPLESKEESKNVQTTDEVADKALMKPKNDDRKQEMQHDDNPQVIAQGPSADASREVRIMEEDNVVIEIHENAEIKTEEVENLEVKTVEPLVQIKEPDAYQRIKFDESYETDSITEQKQENYANYLSSSIEPINPEAPYCDDESHRSSLLSDSPEQQGGTIFRIRPVVALLATVAIASAIFGLYSFTQQRG